MRHVVNFRAMLGKLKRVIVGQELSRPDIDHLSIDGPAGRVLRSMYSREPQRGSDGALHSLDGLTLTWASAGMWLYNLCREIGAKVTVETGCAYGFSSLYFLAAGTCHTAIDPIESTYWHGIASENVRRAGFADRFRMIEEPAALRCHN